jgi:hypothetical protein
MNSNTVIAMMDRNDDSYSYGEIAALHGREPRKNGRAVGSIMNAICRRGRHDLCVRVVDPYGQHHCKVHG